MRRSLRRPGRVPEMHLSAAEDLAHARPTNLLYPVVRQRNRARAAPAIAPGGGWDRGNGLNLEVGTCE